MYSSSPVSLQNLEQSEGKKRKWLTPAFALASILAGVAVAYLVGTTGLASLVIVPGIFLVIIAVIVPEVALLGLLFVIYINLSDVLINYHGFPSIAKPLVGIVLGIILIRATVYKDRFYGWKSFMFLALLYGLVGMIPMLIAADFGQISLIAQDYLKDVFIGLEIILLIRIPKNLRHAIWVLLLAGLLMAGLAYYQQITNTLDNPYWGFGKSIKDSTSGLRVAGPVGDPNTFAQIMAVLMPLALERFWNEKKSFLRYLALGILFLCGFAVVFTYSRGGFLAVAISLLFMAIRRPPRPSLVVGILGIILFIFQLFPENYVERISTLLSFLPNSKNSILQDRSFRGRSSENLVATMMFKDHPLIGVGAGNFNDNYQYYSRRLGLDSRRDPRSAHSLYLEVAAERGILGLISFSAIVSFTYWSLWRAEKSYSRLGRKDFADLTVALSSGLTAYLIAALFLHDAYVRYFWVLIGVAWAAASIAEQAHHSARQSGVSSP